MMITGFLLGIAGSVKFLSSFCILFEAVLELEINFCIGVIKVEFFDTFINSICITAQKIFSFIYKIFGLLKLKKICLNDSFK